MNLNIANMENFVCKVSVVLVCCLNLVESKDYISCRTEQRGRADWFVNYKLPKLEGHKNTLITKGSAYAYFISYSKVAEWKLSNVSIGSPHSMLGETLDPYFHPERRKKLSFLWYNDSPPPPADYQKRNGHTKGIVMFDDTSGVWIIHSVPKFPAGKSYTYPSNGLVYGQHVLCMTFNVTMLNEIGKQLRWNAPYIYAKRLDRNVQHLLDDDVKTLFTKKPKFIKEPPFTRTAKLETRGGMQLTSFAKDDQYLKDLYSELMAPSLNTSLFVQTWRRGQELPPVCEGSHKVQDVTRVYMTPTIDESDVPAVGFEYTKDHCKWAISQDEKSGYVCLGDINRMNSQKKRGGGSLCLKAKHVWSAFRSIIAKKKECREFNPAECLEHPSNSSLALP